MAKLNKTQIALLIRANESRFKQFGVTFGSGNGSKGGLVPHFGGREHGAACKLRDAGLAELANNWKEIETSRGWSVHYYCSTWRLTEKGAKIAAQLI
jgi:hypothetical protein